MSVDALDISQDLLTGAGSEVSASSNAGFKLFKVTPSLKYFSSLRGIS